MSKSRNRNNRLKYSNDGLRDALSGIGGEKDILATGMMGFSNYISRNTVMLSKMYRSNIWVKKACSIPSEYSVKGWRMVSDEYSDIENKLNLKTKTADGLRWSFLYGGSMAVFIVDDGLPPSEPLDLNRVNEKSFKRIIIVDKSKVSFTNVDKDVLSDQFGHPDHYIITIEGRTSKYHPSRVHKFIVNPLPYDESINEMGFGVSQIEIIYKQLINDEVFLSSLANSMKRNGMDIFSIPNLSQLILQGKEDKIKERIRINQSTMSFLNAWVKDGGQNGNNAETYERITSSFAGFDSLDERSLARLAAASEIPATVYLGKSPDGLNSSGASDLSIFSDKIANHRTKDIDPFLDKTDTIIAACYGIEKITYDWINPFPKSEKEEAEIDSINLDNIMKLQAIGMDSNIIASQMVKYGLIDSQDEKKAINSLELEPIDDIDENNDIE